VKAQRDAVHELGERITGEAAARVAASGVDHAVEMLQIADRPVLVVHRESA
jgi:hypothetical protein